MRTRAEAVAEKSGGAAKPKSKTVRCEAMVNGEVCGSKQLPPPDGLCIVCGSLVPDLETRVSSPPAEAAKPPEPEADPWKLKPGSVPAPLEEGVLSLELKRRGYDVTLAMLEDARKSEIAAATDFLRGGAAPEWIKAHFKGVGKVPGMPVSTAEREVMQAANPTIPPAAPLPTLSVAVPGATSAAAVVPERAKNPVGEAYSVLELMKKLELKGLVIGPKELAAWTPEDRAAAAAYVDGQLAASPEFLALFGKKAESTEAKIEAAGKAHREKERKAKEPIAMPPIEVSSMPGDSVTAVWGEEKYTVKPGSYSTVSVGPFSLTTTPRPGETFNDAFERASQHLEVIASQERDRKIRAFAAKLDEVVREASAASR